MRQVAEAFALASKLRRNDTRMPSKNPPRIIRIPAAHLLDADERGQRALEKSL
jgi:hypothetical protein